MRSKISLIGIAVAASFLVCACNNTKMFSLSKLKGTYTIYANGFNTNFDPVSVAGSIVLDGKGNVTGGEQDYFDATAPNIIPQDTITGGTLTLGNDGRGTLTLTPSTAPAETFSIVQVNSKHLLITEFDGNATSAGSMDLQTSPTSAPMGGNSFALLDNWNLMCFGGVITSNGTSVTAGEGDDDEVGNPNFDFSISGSMTAPDASGRGTIDLYDYTVDSTLEFAYYVVGPEAFRLIEIDGSTTDYFLAGSMFGQGTAAGAFSASSLHGNFVFGHGGPDPFFEYGSAGQFTTDGSSTFTKGATDVNDAMNDPVLAGDISTSTYGISSNGYGAVALPSGAAGILLNLGVYMVDPGLNIADPNNTTGGGGALMTDLDTSSLGVGIIVPQATAATFSGKYAFNQDGLYETTTTDGLFDLVGQIKTGSSSSLTGTLDFNDVINTGQNADVTLTGSFAADTANPGRSTAQLTVGSFPISPQNVTIYQASNDLLLHVDTDWSTSSGTGTVSVGVVEKQH